MKNHYDIIVVGAGPAGLLAAGSAAESGASVLILEKMMREGRKLLITGKGRCNITNDAPISEFISHIFPNGKFLKPAFSSFFNRDIIELLEKHGVKSILERGNRYFPASSKSSDVLKGLLKWVAENHVEIKTDSKVDSLIVDNGRVTGVMSGGQRISCNNVILATGGKSYPATGSTGDGYELAKAVGHTIETVLPALVPLNTDGDVAQKLQGLNLKNVKASVWVNDKKISEQFGEMIFTHFGLSGPIILTLSRIAVDALNNRKKVEIVIDLKPALDEQKLDERILRDLNEHGKMKVENLLKLFLPASMIPVFVELLQIDKEKECHQVSAKERKQFRYLLKNFGFKVCSHRSFKEAIITAGGVSTNEISPKTMESKLVKGLYFAGEIIDLDAETGGYNLQIAYSTGWLAGKSAVK